MYRSYFFGILAAGTHELVAGAAKLLQLAMYNTSGDTCAAKFFIGETIDTAALIASQSISNNNGRNLLNEGSYISISSGKKLFITIDRTLAVYAGGHPSGWLGKLPVRELLHAHQESSPLILNGPAVITKVDVGASNGDITNVRVLVEQGGDTLILQSDSLISNGVGQTFWEPEEGPIIINKDQTFQVVADSGDLDVVMSGSK